MTTLQFLGAAGCVTGSRFVLESEGDRVLVDCGLFQGTKELRLRNWAPFPVPPSGLKHVVLTHAHLDHSGYLPKLVNEGFRGTIFATPATVDLCSVLLPDSGHIQESDARFANKKGFSKHKPALPLYTEVEAVETLQFLKPVPYGRTERISPKVSFSFQPAGHIFGSGFIRMKIDDGRGTLDVLFSGDLGRYGQPITHDPTPVEFADYLLVESTYGDRLHESTDAREELARIVCATSERGGAVLIPSFAVGRTQELLYILRELEDAGRIPTLPVYVDSPMAIDATRILMKYPEEHDVDMSRDQKAGADPLNCREVNFVRSAQLSKTLNGMRYPMIVIASSGMATGGRILHHLAHRLPDSRNTVLFVGYQAEGTRGRSLLEGATQLKIHGQMVDVRAEIKMLGQFSAHADYSEMLRWLRNFKRAPKGVFIVHGEPEPRKALEEKIIRELGWNVTLPEHLERFDLK
jgi:metallo-beta-lactamase family protein